MNVQRTDLYVGMFLVATAALVLVALIATRGWGVDRFDLYMRADNAQDLTVDTKIFMQGLEVGRVASISPRPGPSGRLEFILRLSLLKEFRDGTPLLLPRGTTAEITSTSPLASPVVQLSVPRQAEGLLNPEDTIVVRRGGSAFDAIGALANDLKDTIEGTLLAATGTLNAMKHLADSAGHTMGQSRRFMAGVQPGTEKLLAGVAVTLDRLRLLLDSTNTRMGLSTVQLNATVAQSRTLVARLDSLIQLTNAMGAENRPEIRTMVGNMRGLTEQLQYVLDQVGRRPMRLITGVRMPGNAPGDTARSQQNSPRRDTVP